MFLRLHGSITPEMILPLIFVGAWATVITCISKFVYSRTSPGGHLPYNITDPIIVAVNQLLLTVLGFVVGLALSFRSSTAYERYNDARKYWAQLTYVSQNLARLIWIHAEERHSDPIVGKNDLMSKITCLNLIAAFAVALKHKLRFEPGIHYDDLQYIVGHLNTYAKDAEQPPKKKPNAIKMAGQFLGVPMAEDNPRKLVKKARVPIGNLPLEVLSHLSAYMKTIYDNGTFKVSIYQTHSLNALASMNDILTGTERILNTPLPIAYSIAISQITWVYILLLPFQLYKALEWVTIPASIFAAYIILGIALIGREIENPFGDDVNDLPLDAFCESIRKDIDIIMSREPPSVDDFVAHEENFPLYPLSHLGSSAWADKTVDEIRDALASKPGLHYPMSEHNEQPKVQHTNGHRQTVRKDAEKGEAGPSAGAHANGEGGHGGE